MSAPSPPAQILVVDDEPDATELLAFNLQQAGYQVTTAVDGAEALHQAQALVPDLIVLDLMLPKLNGLEVCRTLKRDARTAAVPILMLTAKSAEIDRVVGLELGADDYVTKPFSPRELVLRVKNLLRRGQGPPQPQEHYRIGSLTIDLPRHEVTVAGQPVVLTATEFKLLVLLVERRGRVQSREQLLRDVWGYDTAIDTRTVDTHMRRLRQKMGTSAACLETVRGLGYRMIKG
jgi:two-component system phosphate regulon response regulator PhoB